MSKQTQSDELLERPVYARMPESLAAQMEAFAAADRRSLSYMIREACERYAETRKAATR